MKKIKKILAALFLSVFFIFWVYCIVLNWVFFQPIFLAILFLVVIGLICWLFVWAIETLFDK